MTRQSVHTTSAPTAVGPYSQAVRSGALLFLSGRTPIDPTTGRVVEGGVETQTRQVLANLDDFRAVDAIHAERACSPGPARAAMRDPPHMLLP